MTSLPPRKFSTPNKGSKQDVTPLQILLQMGFQRHRALKALAATGNKSVQLASDWLLTHVSDASLDEDDPREYILYACPNGPLLAQLQEFWNKSKNTCGWNGAHNFPPHITLVSFFKVLGIKPTRGPSSYIQPFDHGCCQQLAPDDCSIQLAKALKQAVETVGAPLDNFLNLEPYISPNFMGLFVCEEHADYLKKIALQYVKKVSSSLGLTVDTYEHLDALATCFPWCAVPQEKPQRSIRLEPHVKSLHITLAYQFPVTSFATLKGLVDEMQPLANSSWELRLYSRDPKLSTHQVHKVTHTFTPRENDELELVLGDYIYLDENAHKNSTDGWIQGTSWLTGLSGYLPAMYTERTAESDAWTLHKAISLTLDNVSQSDNRSSDTESATDVEVQSAVGLSELGRATDENTQREWEQRYMKLYHNKFENVLDENGSVGHISNGSQNGQTDVETKEEKIELKVGSTEASERLVLSMRHGERVDFTYGSWVPFCFNQDGTYTRKDLNMPATLPERAGGGSSFAADGPLTLVGRLQASSVGAGLRETNTELMHVYSSPSLRCVETAHHMLQGLSEDESVKIRIEPSLFEWTSWYSKGLPLWMTVQELYQAGFNVDLDYKPYLSVDCPLFAGNTSESCEEFYERCGGVVRQILADTQCTGGNIMLVGHACTLDTTWAGVSGRAPRSTTSLGRLLCRVPYVSVNAARGPPWRATTPPCQPLMNTSNGRFDWTVILGE